MKYLLVDDDPKMKRIIKQAISGQEDVFVECSDFGKIVELYAAHRPDYVLLDIQADNMYGFTVLKRIRETFPDARVIIITDYDTDASRCAARQAGASAFFSKENLLAVRNFIYPGPADGNL